MMTHGTAVPTLDDFEAKRRSENEAARQEQREKIAAAEAAFNPAHMVKISDAHYSKEAVTAVRFLDTTIHVRFNTGDIVAVTPEQLFELTDKG